MKTSNKTIAVMLATGLITTLTLTGVSAYRGDSSVQGPNYTPERHEEMEKAFETNNFEAWSTLMEGRGRVTNVINTDNFARFAEAHELNENGDIDGAKAIRTELGLGLKDGSNRGNGKGLNKGTRSGSGNRGGNGGCSR